jgi:hypothetical protein
MNRFIFTLVKLWLGLIQIPQLEMILNRVSHGYTQKMFLLFETLYHWNLTVRLVCLYAQKFICQREFITRTIKFFLQFQKTFWTSFIFF